MEQRAVIRFFTLKGLKAKAIHTELESVYGGESLALLTVKKIAQALSERKKKPV
jgi:hypothetical protein